MDRLRGAVIGCGFFAQNHLHAWRAIEESSWPRSATSTRPRRRPRPRRSASPRRYTDARAMLEAERPDFVDVVTTMASHRRLVELAAAQRVPVIVQKPFAPAIDDCRAMVEACAKAGVPLMVHENFRFQTPLRAVREVLEQGAIGQPVLRPDLLAHGLRRLRQPALSRPRGALHHPRSRDPSPRRRALPARRGPPAHLPDREHPTGHPGRGRRHHPARAPGPRHVRGRRHLPGAPGPRPVPRDPGRGRRQRGHAAPAPGLCADRDRRARARFGARSRRRCCPGRARPGTASRRACSPPSATGSTACGAAPSPRPRAPTTSGPSRCARRPMHRPQPAIRSRRASDGATTCSSPTPRTVTVEGRPVRIDGAAANLDFDSFYADLAAAVTRTLFDPERHSSGSRRASSSIRQRHRRGRAAPATGGVRGAAWRARR